MNAGDRGDSMSSAKFDFSGHTALVTGATKGIGRDIAVRLAEAGCAVGATGRNQDELEGLAREVRTAGGRIAVYPCDLADPGQIREMCRALSMQLSSPSSENPRATAPGFDLLVNNAGLTHVESIFDVTVDHWDEVLNVNLRAPLLVTQCVAKDMVELGRGAVVNIGSLAGTVALEDHAAYCSSKWGLHGLSKVMALELAGHGIRVNAVAPTVVLTPMGRKVWGDPAKADPMKAKIPLRRFAETGDVTETVLFLLSDAAAMINGDVVMIDGGYSIA
jgi:NAD(P)-dependent dehydrogenase (short-subunit alcohol dehydrogenase family)